MATITKTIKIDFSDAFVFKLTPFTKNKTITLIKKHPIRDIIIGFIPKAIK